MGIPISAPSTCSWAWCEDEGIIEVLRSLGGLDGPPAMTKTILENQLQKDKKESKTPLTDRWGFDSARRGWQARQSSSEGNRASHPDSQPPHEKQPGLIGEPGVGKRPSWGPGAADHQRRRAGNDDKRSDAGCGLPGRRNHIAAVRGAPEESHRGDHNSDAILFIDEVHMLVGERPAQRGRGQPARRAARRLQPSATTLRVSQIHRRGRRTGAPLPTHLVEPTVEQTIGILKGVRPM